MSCNHSCIFIQFWHAYFKKEAWKTHLGMHTCADTVCLYVKSQDPYKISFQLKVCRRFHLASKLIQERNQRFWLFQYWMTCCDSIVCGYQLWEYSNDLDWKEFCVGSLDLMKGHIVLKSLHNSFSLTAWNFWKYNITAIESLNQGVASSCALEITG